MKKSAAPPIDGRKRKVTSPSPPIPAETEVNDGPDASRKGTGRIISKAGSLKGSKKSSNYFRGRRLRGEVLPNHDNGQVVLALSDDTCWADTSGCRVVERKSRPGSGHPSRFYCRLKKFKNFSRKKKSPKGQEVFSSQFPSKVEAENNLFSFRYEQSSDAVKKLVEKVIGVESGSDADDDTDTKTDNVPKTPPISLSKRRSEDPGYFAGKKLTSCQRRANAMTSNPLIRQLKFIDADRNPRTPGHFNIYNSDLTLYSERRAATKIVRWHLNRSYAVASKRADFLARHKEIQTIIARKLRERVKAYDWRKLLQGCQDREIALTVSTFDISHAYARAQHVATALETMHSAMEAKQHLTWGDACKVSADTFKQYSGRTVELWFRDFNRGEKKGWNLNRFPIIQRGKVKQKAISPFTEKEGDEGLYLQFTSWARCDLEHLTIQKATNYINNTLIKDMLPAEMDKLNIQYPVKCSVVSGWMKECGFHYAPYKKSYEVTTHNRDDVVKDRKKYCFSVLREEVEEPCWVQFPLCRLAEMIKRPPSLFDEFYEKKEDGAIKCKCAWCNFYQYTDCDSTQTEAVQREHIRPAVEMVVADLVGSVEREQLRVDNHAPCETFEIDSKSDHSYEDESVSSGGSSEDESASDMESHASNNVGSTFKKKRGRKKKEWDTEAGVRRFASLGHYYVADEVKMVEFHVDLFEDKNELMQASVSYSESEHNANARKVGGFTSVRKDKTKKVMVRFGHDESIVRAYTLNDCVWMFNNERSSREKFLAQERCCLRLYQHLLDLRWVPWLLMRCLRK